MKACAGSCPEVLPCCQAYLLFRAALAQPYTFGAGSESLEVQLVAPEDIQWEEVCTHTSANAMLALRDRYCREATKGVADRRQGSYQSLMLLCSCTCLQIAFSSISLALRAYIADMRNGRQWHSHHAVIDKRAGSPPNDPNSYVLRDHHELLINGNPHSRS